MKFPFKISELNALLIFVGFSTFTSITYGNTGESEMGTVSGNPLSLYYRVCALAIGSICLYKHRKVLKKNTQNTIVRLYLLILGLMTLRLFYEFYLSESAYLWSQTTKLIYSTFVGGVVAVPILGLISSFQTIDWKKMLIIIFFILTINCFYGLVSTWGNEGRLSLNDHQSTLSFGGYSAILTILCFSLTKHPIKVIRMLALAASIIAIIALFRAGSRGPLISCIAALIFLKILNKRFIIQIFLLLITVTLIGDIVYDALKDISPVMFERLENMLYEGDTSGRDETFKTAISELLNSPLLGTSPLINIHGFGIGPHNLFLQICMGLGILGFIFASTLYTKLIQFALKKRSIDYVAYFFSGLIIYFLTRSMTGINIYQADDFALAVICISLYNNNNNNNNNVPN